MCKYVCHEHPTIPRYMGVAWCDRSTLLQSEVCCTITKKQWEESTSRGTQLLLSVLCHYHRIECRKIQPQKCFLQKLLLRLSKEKQLKKYHSISSDLCFVVSGSIYFKIFINILSALSYLLTSLALHSSLLCSERMV